MNNPLVIAGVEVAVDQHGRFSLNDLHKASCAGKDKEPSEWKRSDATKRLIEEVEKRAGNICITTKEGRGGGTFSSEILAVDYAAWVSMPFRIQVYEVFLAYRRGELVHSSTPPELRARLDSLVEAKAKGLIGGWEAKEMAKEAIRSNWSALPALTDNSDTDELPIFQVLLRKKIEISGPALREPKEITVYEAIISADDDESGTGQECAEALGGIGIAIHASTLSINPGDKELSSLLRLGKSQIRDALMTVRGFTESKSKAMVGKSVCCPLQIKMSAL